ncbi:MAG TPA: hypothetical protein VE464_17180 [Streptosporangiaceae bacterium]|nr:hypothetical protein [Streptosporangiaceae bacterium]
MTSSGTVEVSRRGRCWLSIFDDFKPEGNGTVTDQPGLAQPGLDSFLRGGPASAQFGALGRDEAAGTSAGIAR